MSKKVQVDLSDKTIATLDEIAGQLRRSRNNYKLGVATVIAEIVDGLLSTRPDILHELFENETSVTIEEKARPKSARMR